MGINSIDETNLVDSCMPKYWTCPHCKGRQKSGSEADECLFEHGKYLEHCGRCGYVHIWMLQLTDEFKRRTIDFLVNGGKEKKQNGNDSL